MSAGTLISNVGWHCCSSQTIAYIIHAAVRRPAKWVHEGQPTSIHACTMYTYKDLYAHRIVVTAVAICSDQVRKAASPLAEDTTQAYISIQNKNGTRRYMQLASLAYTISFRYQQWHRECQQCFIEDMKEKLCKDVGLVQANCTVAGSSDSHRHSLGSKGLRVGFSLTVCEWDGNLTQ